MANIWIWIIFFEIYILSSIPARNREMAIEPLSCPYLVIKLHGKYTKLTITQKFVNESLLFLRSINSAWQLVFEKSQNWWAVFLHSHHPLRCALASNRSRRIYGSSIKFDIYASFSRYKRFFPRYFHSASFNTHSEFFLRNVACIGMNASFSAQYCHTTRFGTSP